MRGCNVTVVPYNTTAEEILVCLQMASCYQMVLEIPMKLKSQSEMINGILGKIPFFGICLGHQLSHYLKAPLPSK